MTSEISTSTVGRRQCSQALPQTGRRGTGDGAAHLKSWIDKPIYSLYDGTGQVPQDRTSPPHEVLTDLSMTLETNPELRWNGFAPP